MYNLSDLLKYAIVRNKNLHVKDFDRSVTIEHNDGSIFSVVSAHVATTDDDRFIIIWGEHQTPMIFSVSDVTIKIKKK